MRYTHGKDKKIIKSEGGIIKTRLVYGTVLNGLGMYLLKEKHYWVTIQSFCIKRGIIRIVFLSTFILVLICF